MTNTASRTRRLHLDDGRAVAVTDNGRVDGPVVVLCHPAPGSRVLDPDPAVTDAAGVRLLTLDRPGYGGSSPFASGVIPTITRCADDTAEVLARLGIDEVAVAGWSAGGRVALALAARHPALVRSVALLGTPAPQDAVPWIPEEHLAMADELRADPAGAVKILSDTLGPMAADPPAAVNGIAIGPADEAVLASSSVRQQLEQMLIEAFAQGAVGVATDIVSSTVVGWGFDPAAVGAPTSAFYGEQDPLVPPAHGEWYCAQIPEAVLHTVPDIGHLLALTSWTQVLEALARP